MKFTIWKVASSPSSVLYISTNTCRTYLFNQPVYLINSLLTNSLFLFFLMCYRCRLSPLTSNDDTLLTFNFFPSILTFSYFSTNHIFYLDISSQLILWCCDEAWVFQSKHSYFLPYLAKIKTNLFDDKILSKLHCIYIKYEIIVWLNHYLLNPSLRITYHHMWILLHQHPEIKRN